VPRLRLNLRHRKRQSIEAQPPGRVPGWAPATTQVTLNQEKKRGPTRWYGGTGRAGKRGPGSEAAAAGLGDLGSVYRRPRGST